MTTEFRSNSLFQKALKDAFEVFVNKEVNSKHTNAELISSYCDRALKGGGCVGVVLPGPRLLYLFYALTPLRRRRLCLLCPLVAPLSPLAPDV